MFGRCEFTFAGGYLGSHRQLDSDFQARRPKIFGTDRAAVHTNRLSSDGEPKTVPSRRFRIPVDLIERLEYCLESIFRYARAMIPDRKNCHRLRSSAIDLQSDLHIGSRPCEADCVANNVFTSASKGIPVSISENYRTASLETHGLAQRLCFEVAVSRCFLDELSKVHIRSLRGRKPSFQA